jgi:hypothetical protein
MQLLRRHALGACLWVEIGANWCVCASLRFSPSKGVVLGAPKIIVMPISGVHINLDQREY